MQVNYNLKKQVLENGCCKSLKSQSLSSWKMQQLKSEYDFIYNGLMVFGEIDNISYNDLIDISSKLEKSQEFYNKASQELKAYTDNEINEAHKVNYASYKRVKRLHTRAREIILSNRALFLTLTFNDDVFKNMSKDTRKRMITRFLKKTCINYFANIDFGKKNGQEHYHALVVPKDEKINCYDYKEIFYNANINFKKVIYSLDGNNDIEIASKRISKYIVKLTNHAIKETTQQNRIIYSKA